MKRNSRLFTQAKTIFLAGLIVTGGLVSCGKTNFTDVEHIQRAKDFQDQGDLNASVIELKGALKQKPDNPEARWLLGQIYVDMENGADAEKELMRARELGVAPAAITVPLGRALLLQGKTKQILKEFSNAANAPEAIRADVLTLKGEANLDLKQIEAAQADLSAALEACGNNKCGSTFIALSRLDMHRNAPDRAREWLNKAVTQDPKNARAWVRLGNLEQSQNHLTEAEEAYNKAVQSNPRDIHAFFERAQLHLSTGKQDASKADMEAMRKLAPQSLAIKYLEGRHALLRKDYAPAQASLEAFLRGNPSHPFAAYYLAVAHAAQSHLQQAEDLLQRLFSTYPDSTQVRRLLATVQAQQGASEKAIKTIEPVARQNPNDAAVLKFLGHLFMRTGDLQTGISYLQRAIETEPGAAGTHLALGEALQTQGKADLALAQFDIALKIKPDMAEAGVMRIFTHLSEQQFDTALQAIAAFKTQQPKSPIGDALAASAYTGKKDYPKARQSLEQALILDPKYFPARVALARLALAQNDFATARKQYQDILRQDPAHLDSLLALATLEANAGKPKESLAWLEKARQKHPRALAPTLLLVNAHLQLNEPLKALALARDARRDYPTNASALQALGQAQLAAGETSSAIASFRALTEQLPNAAQTHHLLGMAYLKAQDSKSATASLNKALKLDPALLPAAIALSSLELQNGRTQEALRIARQIQQQQAANPLGYEFEGNVHMNTRAYDSAIKAYNMAYERGKSGGLAIKLATAQHQTDNPAGAYQTLTQWLTSHPDDIAVRAALGGAYQLDGKPQQAIEQYQKIIARYPDNIAALNDLGWLYHMQGDTRALEYAERAYKAAPAQPVVLDTLGWILVQKGDMKRGLDLLQQAASKASGIPVTQYHYASALSKAGREREARKVLETLFTKETSFAEAQDARKLLKQLQLSDKP